MTAGDRAHAPTERRQLSDLISRRKTDLGLSYEDLAARCVDPETGEQTVRYSWMHRLVSTGQVKAPDVAQLRGLAAGLGVPLRSVQDAAAAQFFGMDAVYSDDAQVRTALYHFEEMSPEDRLKVIRLLEAWRTE